MATVAAPAWMLMLLLLSGTPLNLPLSLPPLPVDPVIERMAPDQCIWYLALSGTNKADPKSKNQVEQLLAEDDVQHFVREVSKKLKAAFANAAAQNPVRKTLAEEGPKLIETLLTRPMCIYLGRVEPGPHGPAIHGGLAVNLGEDVAAIKNSLEKLELTWLAAAGKPPSAEASGWHALPMPADAPSVEWGIQEKYLLVGIGEGEAQALNDRRTKSKAAPDWLLKMHDDLSVDRPAMVQYLNVQTITALLRAPLAAVLGPERSPAILEHFGLQNLKYYASVNGLDKEGFVSRSLLAIDGDATGLLSLVGGAPLTAESLVLIPADASFAVAARIDPNQVLEVLFGIVAAFQPEPGTKTPLDVALDHFAGMTGIHLKNDVTAALGDTWCMYNSPDDGGLVFTGLTITATLRDHDKLMKANEKFIAFARQTNERNQQAMQNAGVSNPPINPSILETEYQGQKIFLLNFVGQESPVAPAWCITDKHLIVSLFPQTIKANLERQSGAHTAASGKKSLADLPAVAQQMGGAGPIVLAYQDTPGLFKLAYPLVEIFAQFACSELQREGFDLDVSMLPNARAIAPHLLPGVGTVRSTKEGIRMESHGTMPMGIGSLPLIAMPIGLFFARQLQVSGPVNIGLAPGVATQNASMNKLKEIALALHTFEDSTHTLPAAFAATKDGQPLLSWRVAILPFIGQQDLLSQFKLDEPWDSENNKKLIERMPELFKTPGSKAAAEFKTVYLTVRGEKTPFPGAQPIKLRSVTDGTAQTIMVVEASDGKAVIWTKPDDFEPDDKNPVAGLLGLRDGAFLVVFCDGHVEALPEDIDPDNLKSLFTRNGGEPINGTGSDHVRRRVPAAAK